MSVNADVIWWGRDRRKKGIRLIGTIPAFGWSYNVVGRSAGLQVSLGVVHCYVLFSSRTRGARQ